MAIVAALVPTKSEAAWYSFKAVTFNMHGGTNDQNQNRISEMVTWLRNSGADVIALQEVTRFRDQPCDDDFAILSSALADIYPFASFDTTASSPADLFICGWGSGPRIAGNAIFSKYPVISSWSLQLPTTWSPRKAMTVFISVGGTPFVVYNTHLQNDSSDGTIRQVDRRNQAQAIANDIAPRVPANNVFVLGDFNAWSGSWELGPLEAILVPPTNSTSIDFGYTFGLSSTMTRHEDQSFGSLAPDHFPVTIQWYYWK